MAEKESISKFCPISNSDCQIWLSNFWPGIIPMAITIVKLISQKLLIKNSLNWFEPICAQVSDITDSQKNKE